MKKVVLVLIILLILFIGTFLYARFIGTKGLKVKEYKIVNSKITNDYYGLKIVHLSDIHFGTINTKELEKIVEKVNYIEPDIIVLTGDLLSEKTYSKEELINTLSKLESKLGKFAISGNHDIIEEYEDIIDKIGFTNLNNSYELIYQSKEPIIISGMSSNLIDSNINSKVEKFNDYMNSLTEDDVKPIYSILLIHEPDYIDKIDLTNYDLVLGGHSHAGQVRFPLIGKIITPNGSKKYYNEYYKVDNKDFYISSGIGTSVMKVRLFNKPSFNFYRITNK